MDNIPYQNREIDKMFAALEQRLFHEETGFLPRIERQTTKTNGRVTKLERYVLIVGTAVAVTIALKYPALLPLLKHII